ncbi:type II toxin-antitoxin system VapC family toxin [Candidatus Daviesbacteria bacterium]|nr:type II toxin-antitoxin system VapC family toxin [Candidatus Daviesbacteria bacterium]
MKYILDTNQIINYFHNIAETIEKLTPLFREGIAISVITIAEYLRGAYRSGNPRKNIKVFQDFLITAQIRILPVDLEIANQYAKFQANFEKNGERIPNFDLLIASTAMVHNLTLISGDKIFKKIKNLKLI